MISIATDNVSNRVSWIIFIVLAVQSAHVLSAFTDVPPPPKRPERFHSREELKRYLQLVHEYYAIIGRPRFGRSMSELKKHPSDEQLFHFFDINGDNTITYDEFVARFGNHQ